MIPIHALLARIRWDPAFGRGEFVIGYYDRVARRIVHVSLRQLAFADHDHFACTLVDNEGEAPQLPVHRIRQVLKDGRLIWQHDGNGRCSVLSATAMIADSRIQCGTA